MTDRKQWEAQRRTGIGGSDAASIFNVGYGCRRRLFYDKRGIEPDYPFDESLIIKLGNLMEPFFADQYQEKTGRILSRSESREHPKYPEARVNPDRLIADTQRKDPGVLEIKSQGSAVYSKTKREGLSEQYIIQEEHGMFVTGTEWGSFQIGNRDSGESTHWDVERSADIQKELEREVPAIWKLIQSDAELPDRLEVDDFRCSGCQWRKTCQGDALIHVSGKSDLIPAEDIRPILADYDQRKPLFDEAEALLEETKEALRSALVDRPAVCVGAGKKDRKVYYRSQAGRTSWETEDLIKKYEALRLQMRGGHTGGGEESFDAEYPAAEKFKREGLPFRVLRIY
jgi:hypothetical protein